MLFLLLPDASASRRIRRLVAERGACGGIVAGTWGELIDSARRAYLLPEPADDWDTAFRAGLATLEDAFWSASFKATPDETAYAVEAALTDLVSASDPATALSLHGVETLAERPCRHVRDLVRLVETLGGRLPPELEATRSLLTTDPAQALRPVRVLHVSGVPALTRRQLALVDKLNRDAGACAGDEAGLIEILQSVLTPTGGRATGALGVLQAQLFAPVSDKVALDHTVQWVGVRDFLQEAEVAAGMVQTMLREDASLAPSDIGLLVPDSFEYAVAIEDAFRLGGLAVSGLPVERWRRDLGREAVFHFLYCRQKPAPAMALAVCLSSPLMPWSREDGAVLAQSVMDGRYELKPLSGMSHEARAMLELLREGDSEPGTLSTALGRFAGLLSDETTWAGPVAQARATVEPLVAMLAASQELDWTVLKRAAIPKLVTSGEAPEFNREGVTIWRAGQEPWRPVKRLLVLGFAQGQYPTPLGSDPVFSAEDLAQMRSAMDLPVKLPAEELTRRRDRFRRQLAAASESVTFLVPRRDFAGEAQAPSESLVFMHQLFEGPEEAGELVLDLDAAEQRARVRHLALAEPAVPRLPRRIEVADLEFGRDLLALRTDRHGQPKPESPSGLERLMVSGLAWLLNVLEAEPLDWAPEDADPLVLGSVAHEVFEGLFAPGAAPPAREDIPRLVETLLEEALRRLAPFLRGSQWTVERRNFAALTTRAALAWRDALEQLGAEVLAAEEWLAGTWHGIAVHGQTDLVLGLPGGRLLVVDYKRSKSTGRLKQMQKGFDSQASLYRAMIETGGPKGAERVELARQFRAAQAVGVVYYLLNDQKMLSDSELDGAASVPGWRTLENDIAGEALARIGARVDEIRAGTLRLNRTGDREFYEKKAGLTPYALDASPLIGLFSVEDDDVEHEADE